MTNTPSSVPTATSLAELLCIDIGPTQPINTFLHYDNPEDRASGIIVFSQIEDHNLIWKIGFFRPKRGLLEIGLSYLRKKPGMERHVRLLNQLASQDKEAKNYTCTVLQDSKTECVLVSFSDRWVSALTLKSALEDSGLVPAGSLNTFHKGEQDRRRNSILSKLMCF